MLKSYLIKSYVCWHAKLSPEKNIKTYHQDLITQLGKPISQVPLLAIDMEMTGLDPKKDQIISIGCVPIINGQIQLKEAQHKLIKIKGSVGQSATIHGVLDRDLTDAIELEDALNWLFQEAKGKIIVAHHAPLDLNFIQQKINKQEHTKCRIFAIDTMNIEHKRLLRKQIQIKDGELRLNSCRSRYNLPAYPAHSALIDAIACAELLLAQLSQMGSADKIKVAELIS